MRRVIIRAPLLSVSGYGVHSRQIYRWVRSLDDTEVIVNIVPWGNTSWLIDPDAEGGLIGDIMKSSNAAASQDCVPCDLSIQVQLPNEWDPTLAKKNIGVSAFVETDICNKQWLDACNRMTAIVVPSNHVVNCIRNTGGVSVPLHVIPETYHESIDTCKSCTLDLKFSTNFNFLVVGQLTGNNPENDRKNIFYTCKWFFETFADDPDVGIIVKTNSSRNTSIDRFNTTRIFETIVRETRKGSNPRVYLLHGEMTDDEMSQLYLHESVKALLTLTRGEGFGLPILEAAASGLPVIATSWSGHTDFLNLGKYTSVSYELVPIDKSRVDNQIFVNNAKWANVVEGDVKKKLQKFRKSPDVPKEWARSLRDRVRERFSRSAVERVYGELLRDYLN